MPEHWPRHRPESDGRQGPRPVAVRWRPWLHTATFCNLPDDRDGAGLRTSAPRERLSPRASILNVGGIQFGSRGSFGLKEESRKTLKVVANGDSVLPRSTMYWILVPSLGTDYIYD